MFGRRVFGSGEENSWGIRMLATKHTLAGISEANRKAAKRGAESPNKQPEQTTQGSAVEKTDSAATTVAAEAAPNSETR